MPSHHTQHPAALVATRAPQQCHAHERRIRRRNSIFAPRKMDAWKPQPASGPKQKYRSVFLSDTHLGTPQAQAEALQSFLSEVQTERLFLVGDIVDGWKLSQSWFWPASHTDVLSSLLALGQAGTRIVYLPGNHDEALRPYLSEGVRLGNLELQLEALHVTAKGERLLVLHGDRCDTSVHLSSAWTRFLGDRLYDVFVHCNLFIKALRRMLGLPYWSLAGAVHSKSRFAKQLVERYELALIAEARRRNVDGVVCGHIHKPCIRRSECGVLYLNTGDWVDSCSALVEDWSGRLSLLHWMPHHEARGRQRQQQEQQPQPQPQQQQQQQQSQPHEQKQQPASDAQPPVLAEADLIRLVQLLSQGEGHALPDTLLRKLARSSSSSSRVRRAGAARKGL